MRSAPENNRKDLLLILLPFLALTLVACAGRKGSNAKVTRAPIAPAGGKSLIVDGVDPQVTLHTNQGAITLQLFEDQAPNTVTNFVYLAQKGFYTGTRFHRIIKGFMMQGGDPLTTRLSQKSRWGSGGPGYKFPDEKNGLKNQRGFLSMANAGPDTNGSQFFVLFGDASHLDGKHTVFGRVASDSMAVIKRVERDIAPAEGSEPKEEVLIERVTVDRRRDRDYTPEVWMDGS